MSVTVHGFVKDASESDMGANRIGEVNGDADAEEHFLDNTLLAIRDFLGSLPLVADSVPLEKQESSSSNN
jgi:hypothetical protein